MNADIYQRDTDEKVFVSSSACSVFQVVAQYLEDKDKTL